MDKFRPILAAVQKYQFWVLSVLVTVVALVCWWLATNGLAGQYQKRKSQLETAFNSARIQPDHPNQKVIDEVNKQHDLLKQNVYSAWESLYSKQKEQNPFPAVLGEEFRKRFEELKPKDSLARPYLELYQNFIKGHLPSLRTKINVRRPKDEHAVVAKPVAGMGGMGGTGATGRNQQDDIEMIGVVDWDERDFNRLAERFEWRETPSTLAVVLAQEDLWVYEALLRVIANANEGAASPANAAVKRIEALQIGKDSYNAWKNSEATIFAAQSAALPTEESAPYQMGRPMAPGGAAEDQNRRQLMENRYVDDKGKFLPYDSEYPYAKHPYAEFKLMPIAMNLVIDQRKLPKFLAECANSNMPIEVRRVRLLKGRVDAADPGQSAGPGGGGMGMGMGGAAGGAGNGPATPPGTSDMPVEVHAVIYIYNPPDREKLGTGTASEQKPAAGH